MTRIHVLTISLLLCAIMLPSRAIAEDTKKAGNDNNSTKATPKQIVLSFFGHLSAGEIEKAKGLLFMPINNPMVASRLDDILNLIAKEHKDGGKVHAFDEHVLGGLAVVIYGTEGSQFTDKIDIDPLFFRKTDCEWKLVLANSAESLMKHELPNDELRGTADKLLQWYREREPAVRKEWRNRNKDND